MSIPATVFYFTAYEHLKHYMGYCEDNPATQYVPMLAGSAARGKAIQHCCYVDRCKADQNNLIF